MAEKAIRYLGKQRNRHNEKQEKQSQSEQERNPKSEQKETILYNAPIDSLFLSPPDIPAKKEAKEKIRRMLGEVQ